MIKRYQFGDPIDTEAVLIKPEVQCGIISQFTVDEDRKALSYTMDPDAIVYGLGETVRGINKRGWLYTSNNSDEMYHLEGRHSLYASHNFIIVTSAGDQFGIFVDTPGKVNFDIGYTEKDILEISFDELQADIYEVRAESLRAIVREFRTLIGRSYIPPKWAFGYGQSRWSYMNEDEIREVVKSHDEIGSPLDMVYLDIDYMDHYKDFTVNHETFPDFESFVSEMKEQGIHLVPIIDAGVKIEHGYSVYEEGVKNGYFVTEENGKYFVAAVWPGLVHFPDFLKKEARTWFGDQYGILLSKGIDGFWNDMNEPAIFYSEDHLKEAFAKIDEYKNRELDEKLFFELMGLLGGISHSPEDYKRFWHEIDGKKVRHDRVHNLYGYNMTRAAGEAFERLSPDKRILMFSRASYIGMHRYGGLWTGDNRSWWSHLLLNLQQMSGLNMCGFLYSGADMGGFDDNCTEDLLMRWVQLSMFTPLMRNHSCRGSRRQEIYRFEKSASALSEMVKLRYALLPYIYSEFMKAALHNDMYILALGFEYPNDERARRVEDQVMVGESIMIAPVYTQNARGRYVYLPEDMKLIRFRSVEDYDEEILEQGDHYVSIDLHETAVFLRKGHVLPLAAPAERSRDIDYSTIHYLSFEGDPKQYELYNDDGEKRI